jgi:hypothetical protein
VEYLIQVLASKTQQDVVETIKVLTKLHHYNIPSTHRAIQKMLPLIFSRDPKIVEIVVQSINTLYIVGSSEEEGENNSDDMMSIDGGEGSENRKAKNLIKLMMQSTLVEITCIEEYFKRAREDSNLLGFDKLY